MMVDLSGYCGKTILLAICGDDGDLGLIAVDSDDDNKKYSHFMSCLDGESCWVDDRGEDTSGNRVIRSLICEVDTSGLIRQQTTTDPMQQLLDNLISQNAALTKIIADYMAGRGCN